MLAPIGAELTNIKGILDSMKGNSAEQGQFKAVLNGLLAKSMGDVKLAEKYEELKKGYDQELAGLKSYNEELEGTVVDANEKAEKLEAEILELQTNMVKHAEEYKRELAQREAEKQKQLGEAVADYNKLEAERNDALKRSQEAIGSLEKAVKDNLKLIENNTKLTDEAGQLKAKIQGYESQVSELQKSVVGKATREEMDEVLRQRQELQKQIDTMKQTAFAEASRVKAEFEEKIKELEKENAKLKVDLERAQYPI
jgi:chromosome segregation ATPase